MAPTLVRSALTLLSAFGIVFAAALFPVAFDVELQTADVEPASTPAPTPEPVSTPTPTPTPTPTDTSTPVPPDRQRGGGPWFGWVPDLTPIGWLGVLLVGGLLVAAAGRLMGGDATSSLGLSLRKWIGAVLGRLPLPSVASRLSVSNPIGRIPQLTVALLVAGSARFVSLLSDAETVAGTVGRNVTAAIGPSTRRLGGALLAFPRALLALVVAPLRVVAGGSVAALLPQFRGGFERPALLKREEPPTADGRRETDVPPGESPEEEAPPTVREAWRAMTDHVPVPNPEATTPGEYARRAIDIGMPATAVRALTGAFREVVYGNRPATDDRRDRAWEALERIRGWLDR